MKRQSPALLLIWVLLIYFCLAFPISGFSASVKKGKSDSSVREVPAATKARQKSGPVKKSPGKASFPLTIVSTFIKNQTLIVTIGNTGAKLSPKDHGLIKLKVSSASGRLKKQWLLSKVDSKRRLLQPKGRVAFNTSLQVTQSEKVTVDLIKRGYKLTRQATLQAPGKRHLHGERDKSAGQAQERPPASSHEAAPLDSILIREPANLDYLRCGDVEQIIQPTMSIYKYRSTPGRTRVCIRVQNESDHDFNSPVGANVYSRNEETKGYLDSFHVGSVNSVPAGSSELLGYGRLNAPAEFIEWGHRTPQVGECQASLEIKVILDIDPDIHSDADPTNDDCLKDNTRIYKLPYMAACPR